MSSPNVGNNPLPEDHARRIDAVGAAIGRSAGRSDGRSAGRSARRVVVVRRELGVLSRLGAPMIVSQLGMLLMGIVDIYMVGKLGPSPLAAVALGDLFSFGTSIVAMGILMGLDPIVTQAHGRRDGRACALALQQATVLAGILAIPVGALWLFAEPALRLLGQEESLLAGARDYCRANLFGLAPFLGFIALRHYLQGRGKMMAPLVAILLANVANVFFNWVLIYGNLGFPALGIAGSGIATGLSRTCLFVCLWAWTLARGLHRDAWVPWSRESFELRGMRRILGFGLPIGLQFGLEVWAFNTAALFAGWLGTTALAAHTIAIRLASLSFMMPVGISIAAATRVGNLLGANRRRRAQRAAWVAIGMGAAVMTTSAVAFVVLRRWLPDVFTDDLGVIALGAATLPVAAAFQLFDGVQCVAAGVLRGMGTTRPAAVFNLVGFWILALPLAWMLGFGLDMGLPGIWWGLAGGLGAVALMLVGWVLHRGPAYLARSR